MTESVAEGPRAPARHGLVLTALICATAVGNLNLAVANVVLPVIGRALDASQTGLDAIAVSYTLGLAASVLYFGALGDRYGRKLLLALGVVLSIPVSLLAAYAPSVAVLAVARLLGGVLAGIAYPLSLALIVALWRGPPRTRSIALWAAVGTGLSALGPLTAGWLLGEFWWGSVFLITVPVAAAALVLVLMFVPGHVEEASGQVDHLGGVASVLFVGSLVLAISLAPTPGRGPASALMAGVAVTAGAVFLLRQRRARMPLFDLRIGRRRVFWVAAATGVLVFGALAGAMYIGQQFVQNVLGYTPLQAGLALLPSAMLMVVVAPWSARLISAHGSRITLLTGHLFCLLGFAVMLFLWQPDIGYWAVGLGYSLMGIGVRLAGTPTANSLTVAVPVRRAGMASGIADLQGDLGAAIMQSVLGALLGAGYAARIDSAVAAAPNHDHITDSVTDQLQRSFASAQDVAQRYPAYASKITGAAESAFLAGSHWAYTAGISAVLLGALLAFFAFPRKQQERALLSRYHRQDTGEIRRRGRPRARRFRLRDARGSGVPPPRRR